MANIPVCPTVYNLTIDMISREISITTADSVLLAYQSKLDSYSLLGSA